MVGLFGRRFKKDKARKADSATPATATVSVFVNMEKIERVQGGKEKWDNFFSKVSYPHYVTKTIFDDGEGVVIVAPDNQTAISLTDEINGIMGMRRAAKLVAPESLENTEEPVIQ